MTPEEFFAAEEFVQFMKGDDFVSGYVEDLDVCACFGLEYLHLLVPCSTMLDDFMVSLYGSRCLHLPRPLVDRHSEYKYIGRLAALANKAEHLPTYAVSSSFRMKKIDKEGPSSPKRGLFILV